MDSGIMFEAGDIVMRRLIFDRDDDVLDQIGEAFRKRFQRFAYHELEFGAPQVAVPHLNLRL
jgi:hypothetical protein